MNIQTILSCSTVLNQSYRRIEKQRHLERAYLESCSDIHTLFFNGEQWDMARRIHFYDIWTCKLRSVNERLF